MCVCIIYIFDVQNNITSQSNRQYPVTSSSSNSNNNNSSSSIKRLILN